VGKDAISTMRRVPTRKASAACGSPGFFYLVICGAAALIALSAAAAQESRPVGLITITGNESIATSTVLAWMETKQGTPFVQSDPERIISRYASEGFLFARIDSVRFLPMADGSTVGLVLSIREGKRAVVSSMQMDGLKALKEREVEESLSTRRGEKFVPAVLEQDIGTLLQLYEKSGYPFARVEIRDIRFNEMKDSVGAAITLGIDEGVQARIQNLRVEGNTTTKTSVITREARLTEGEVFRGDQPRRVQQRLERMQLFSSVSTPALYLNPDGSVGLSVKVTEGNPNRFDGIVGYVPSGGSGSGGYITGLVDVQFRNILGTGRKLSARWYRETETSQEIELRYREPWVASLPLNAEAGFVQRKQDSTYIRNSFSLFAELMATDELNLGAVFSNERVLPTEGYGVRVANESRTTSIGLSVSYDSRNDPVTPTSGLRYRTEYRTGIKEIQTLAVQSSSDRSSTQRLSFDFEYFFSPIQKQVLFASLSFRDFRSGGVELSDMYRLGGSNTLRGYREGQFLGSRIAWSNLEYRVLTDRRSYAFGLVDIGYVLVPDRPQAGLVKQEIYRVGYGAGIRLDTPLGLIGVSLAFGEGDTFSTAKLHIRLINEF
jgi:outer membrane protein insertion porin family